MPTTTEPTRLQLDLRAATWIAPGLTAISWATGGSSPAPVAPGVASGAIAADCTCPSDCIRDHETD
jgi:hypothetical protein